MKLIEAKITGQPRTVNTKHGDRAVVDARAADGENLTIWRPANDPAVMRLANGERVQLAIDSKGKVSLVETAFDRAEEAARPMGFKIDPVENSRSVEIADYIDRLGKLYTHCKTKAEKLNPNGADDLAMALFQQSIEHFQL
jgi:hypothetical protein